MRQHTESILRNALGNFEGSFSPEWCNFFEDVERRYASGQNGQHMLAEAVVPLWIERAKDKGVPLEKADTPLVEPLSKRGPGRPRKAQAIGV
jgi:hypothetical protein